MSEPGKGVLLIVEDELQHTAALRASLSEAGYSVLESATAAGGLRHLHAQHVDAVLADLRVSDMDGLQLLEKVKSQSPQTHVIFMATTPTADAIAQAMKHGASDFHAKPVRAEVLLGKLQAVLDGRTAGTTRRVPPTAVSSDGDGHESHAVPQRMVTPGNSPVPGSWQRMDTVPGMADGLTETIAGLEKSLINDALHKAAGNQAKAAQFLRIPRTTLRDKMAKYGMVGDGGKREPLP